MYKLTAIKIKYDDGTYSGEIPVSVLAENVEWDNTHTLVDVLGSIDVDVTGTIQDQISQLFNDKVSASAMQDYVTNSMPTYITNWLNTNVNPVGSAVVVDSSLTVSGAAADAKVTGDRITAVETGLDGAEDDIADLKNATNAAAGVIQNLVSKTANKRYICIPTDFESGKTYIISVRNASVNLQSLQVKNAANVNSDSIIRSWGGLRDSDITVTYICDRNDADYVVLIAPDGTSSFTFDLTVYVAIWESAENGNILNAKIDALMHKTFILGDLQKYIKTFIQKTDGAAVQDNSFTASDYIPIPQNAFAINCSTVSTGSILYNAFYDEGKVFVSAFTWSGRVNVPANAKFMRCSFHQTAFDAVNFTYYYYDDVKKYLENTIYWQLDGVGFSVSGKNVTLSLEANIQNNLGFFKLPWGESKYFVAPPSALVSDNTYSISIPRYAALVLDVTKIVESSYKVSAELKTYDDIKDTDYILFSNHPGLGGTSLFGGALFETKMLRKINDYRLSNNDTIMRSVSRFGVHFGQPESPAAIKACHDAGYNIVRVNLQYTSDGVAVLWHDPYINQYFKNVYDSNNKLVPYSDDDRIGIAETPVATLDLYKWGGTSYAAGIVRAESVIAATRKLGMELYLECKQSLSDTQIADILSLIRKYGMTDRTSFATANRTAALAIATQEPRVRIGYTDSKFTSALQNDYLALKAVTNNLFWWGWSTLIPTKEMVEFLNANGIEYECGDFSSFNDITTYLNNQYAWYCTGMELSSDLSLSPLLGQYIEQNM